MQPPSTKRKLVLQISMGHLVSTIPALYGSITLCLILLLATAAFLRKLAAPRRSSSRRGLSIQVTDRAVARRALVQHSAAFLDRPTSSVPSTILTRNLHHNVLSAPYGPYWRAVRSHMATGVLHPSRFAALLDDTRAPARVLGDLVRALKMSGGAPAGETLHFAVYNVLADTCFWVTFSSRCRPFGCSSIVKYLRSAIAPLPVTVAPARGVVLAPCRRGQEEAHGMS